MQTDVTNVKKQLNVSCPTSIEVLRAALSSKINRLHNDIRAIATTQDEAKRSPEYSTYCDLSRQYYKAQGELQELNANDPVFQAELKELNTKAMQSFNKDPRFAITE